MSLIEKIARAMAAELGMQEGERPFILGDDLTLEYLDQDNVDFGKVAQAALTAMLEGFGGDGVTDADREAVYDLARKSAFTGTRAFDPANQAFARHRQLSAAAERARIVAWLRGASDGYDNPSLLAIADAIEQWEV